jgi:hypothetical protein
VVLARAERYLVAVAVPVRRADRAVRRRGAHVGQLDEHLGHLLVRARHSAVCIRGKLVVVVSSLVERDSYDGASRPRDSCGDVGVVTGRLSGESGRLWDDYGRLYDDSGRLFAGARHLIVSPSRVTLRLRSPVRVGDSSAEKVVSAVVAVVCALVAGHLGDEESQVVRWCG